MRTKVIKIGNSHYIRIPKAILRQVGIEKEVELGVERDRIILKPVYKHCQGWSEAFRRIAAEFDDQLLDGDVDLEQGWTNQPHQIKD